MPATVATAPMPLRCVYTDLDGTLLGHRSSLFRDAEGSFSLAQARALEACHRAGAEVVIMSGRREPQVHEAARLMGQTSYIYEAGFEMLDVGAVAAKAGPPVPAADEAAALVPAIEGVVRRFQASPSYSEEKSGNDVAPPVSADTFSAQVARGALAAGASVVNDISGGSEEMFELVAGTGCGYVLMHIEGPPRVDRPWRDYGDVVDHLRAWFEGRVELARDLGVAEEQIAIDPGLDFDLSPEQDLEILRRLGELRALGLPLYVSLSRKDVLGAVLAGSWEGRLPAGEREWGTVGAVALAVPGGADVLRIHDRSSLQAMRVAGRISRSTA